MGPGRFGGLRHSVPYGYLRDGNIHAFDPISGKFAGTLLDPSGHAIKIDGLWALAFGGCNPNSGAANKLFFTARLNDESDGLLGKLSAVATEQRGSSEYTKVEVAAYPPIPLGALEDFIGNARLASQCA